MHVFRKLGALLGLLVVASVGVHAASLPQYNRDIKPILGDHCFNCHGQDEKSRKGKLRLDVREDALKGGKSGTPAIVPGKPEQSELIARITTHDEDDVMPPTDMKKPLSAEQVEKLKQWIKSGAEYQGHWAFTPPQKPELPRVNRKSKNGNPIDAFVLARLEREKLKPSPEARPEVLLRRVCLDITGIPPTPSEVDAFVADYAKRGNAAFIETVDRLLASPRYAEKWTRWWLDAARYADSDGYEKDLPREQWTWRDWVLDAFKNDMPYDRFIVEQIAGDVLPNATQAQRIATGFLRNGMVNEEGAIINEQFRLEGMFDRMDVIGKSVLGLTLQCAQCHTHKYDPISHEEYYRMFAFINDTYEATSWIYSKEQQAKIDSIHRAAAEKEAEMKKRVPDWEQRLAAWETDMAQKHVEWTYVDAIENEWVGGLAHPEKQKDKSILTLGFRPTHGELWVSAMTKLTNITGLRIEALTHGDLPYNGPGRSYKGTFALSELEVEAAPIPVIGANTNHAAEIKKGLVKLRLTNAVADIEAPTRELEPKFRKADDKRRVGPARYLIDGKEDTAWTADLGPGRRHHDSQVVMRFATNGWESADGTFLKFWLKFRHGGPDAHGRDNNFLGRFRLAVTTAPDPHADPLPAAARAALHTPREKRTAEQQKLLFAEWRKSVPELKELNDQFTALWKDYPEGHSVLHLAQRDPEWRRDTPIYDRGNWQKPGKVVQPGVPAFLHALPKDAAPDRVAFAKWLVDPRSPTTARVAVNRTWQSIFGMGLVETAEDFGVRSDEPKHPELLDWLSVGFVEGTLGENKSPWSLKQLIRAVVLSSTYRQDSRASDELLERDPRNRLLARGPRFRAEAELVRDIALSASGLLHERMGGRSFFPPVPESLFAINYLKIDWKPAPAPDRYRRSLYMFRRRSMPDPVLGSFDAPNGDFSCVRRVRSNTPLAALASLNEPVFVEAAQALALRTLREGGKTDEQRAAYAFRLCTGRAPKPTELATTLEFLRSREAHIADGWVPAKELAAGDSKFPELPSGTNPKQLAAWTVVSRVLLNLDETLTKN
jgi:hypothetical protein